VHVSPLRSAEFFLLFSRAPLDKKKRPKKKKGKNSAALVFISHFNYSKKRETGSSVQYNSPFFCFARQTLEPVEDERKDFSFFPFIFGFT